MVSAVIDTRRTGRWASVRSMRTRWMVSLAAASGVGSGWARAVEAARRATGASHCRFSVFDFRLEDEDAVRLGQSKIENRKSKMATSYFWNIGKYRLGICRMIRAIAVP